jgi:hypothetical protein
VEGIWERLKKEFCKQNLMGDSGNSEDQHADRNTDSEDWAYDASNGNLWELDQRPFMLQSGKEFVYILSAS